MAGLRYSKLVGKCASTIDDTDQQNFADNTQFVSGITQNPAPGEILVKNRYIGIDGAQGSTQQNSTSAESHSRLPCVNGSSGDEKSKLRKTLELGEEGLGQVVAVGKNCSKDFQAGDFVTYAGGNVTGAYAEYTVVLGDCAFKVPQARPEYLVLHGAGVSAELSLRRSLGQAGLDETTRRRNVFITCGTSSIGHLVVQLAKLAGHCTAAMCNTVSQSEKLKNLGCDKVINFSERNWDVALGELFPDGIHLVHGSVGDWGLETALRHLAVNGNLALGDFGNRSHPSDLPAKSQRMSVIEWQQQIVEKSASLHGFSTKNCTRKELVDSMARLLDQEDSGELKVAVDFGESTPGGCFEGLKSLPRAVQYCRSDQNFGKVAVALGGRELAYR